MSEILHYYCLSCKFKTGARKIIRKHLKEVHKLKGQKAPPGVDREPLSVHYERR